MAKTAFQNQQCPFCPKAYKYLRALVNHAKHHAFDEVVPDGLAAFLNEHKRHDETTYVVGLVKEQVAATGVKPERGSAGALRAMGVESVVADPLTSVDTALQGAALVRDVAARLRNANQATREKLARDLEGLAFGLQFLFDDLKATNYREAVEKARKWDKLMAVLPIMEAFVKGDPDVRVPGGSES